MPCLHARWDVVHQSTSKIKGAPSLLKTLGMFEIRSRMKESNQ